MNGIEALLRALNGGVFAWSIGKERKLLCDPVSIVEVDNAGMFDPGIEFILLTRELRGDFCILDEKKVPWDRDITDELPRNENCPGLLANGWWQRTLDQIVALTFHHTLSDDPFATARYYVTKGGGRPSIPYAIWVTQTGEVLKCMNFEDGCWHDHTGHKNRHLSVGLAGSLHLVHPSDAQLDAAARVAAWAIKTDMLPGITGIGQIKGHMDFARTVCPGWASDRSGRWRNELYAKIELLLS